MMFFVGIKYEIKMESTIPFNKPYIICPNHKSYLDIVLMYLIIPHDFAFIGKSELLKWPVVRIFFKRGVDIPVYRDSVA
ncbi:MAG: lysophospholipid acyltransferase family protein, partial [Bacteroidota bacterium]|nr:lysophospholipid acyltransferase family protein [Bacteroidota bacterium]